VEQPKSKLKPLFWVFAMKQAYNALKREVAMTLTKCLFGDRRKPHLKKENKKTINELMRELDKTFKEHGVDWKLTE